MSPAPWDKTYRYKDLWEAWFSGLIWGLIAGGLGGYFIW